MAFAEHKDVTDFIKYIIELGGRYVVDDNYYLNIRTIQDGEYKLVKETLKEGPDSPELPIVIYHENREPGNYHLMNPFKENVSTMIANEIFYAAIECHMAILLKDILETIAALDSNDENMGAAIEAFGHILSNQDVQFKKEVAELDLIDILEFSYELPKKTVRLVYKLENPEVQEKYKKTQIRKKSWKAIVDLFTEIMREKPIMCHKTYYVTAKGVSIPKAECYLKLYNSLLKHIEPVAKQIIGTSFNMSIFDDHLPSIEQYKKLVFMDDGIKKQVKEIKSTSVPDSRSNSGIPPRSSIIRIPGSNRGYEDEDRRSGNIPSLNRSSIPPRSKFIKGFDEDRLHGRDEYRSKFRVRLR